MNFTELPADAVLDQDAQGRGAYGSGGVEDNGTLTAPGTAAPKTDQAPEGATDVSYDASTGEVISYRDPTTKRLTINVRPDKPVYSDLPDDAPLDGEQKAPGLGGQVVHGLGAGARNILGGAGQLANLATSPIRAGMSAIGLPDVDYEHIADHIADQLGLAKSGHVAQAISRGIVSGLLTGGLAAPVAGVGGAVGATADALAATPVADAVSQGAGAGASEVAKDSGAGPVGQIAAGLVGGGLGAAGAVGVPAAVRNLKPLATDDFTGWKPDDLLAAFQRQQVTPMADQVGGTASRMASGVSRMTLGGIPLAQAAEKSVASARAARDRIAGLIGRVTDDTGAGQAAQRGAKSFISSTERRAGSLYDAVPIAGSKLASLSNTRDALYDLTRGMDSNPELSALVAENSRLKGFLDALTPKDELVERYLPGGGKGQPFIAQKGGELSWQDLKRFRSIIGEIAGQPTLAQDTSQQAIRKLYAGLSEDMRATARADGPKSLASFERANTFWRARQARIDNVLTNILGDDLTKSPESAFRQIENWSREGGDAARIAQTLRSLPEDEANTVRATIFSRMGNQPARGQGEAAVFTPTQFARQWSKLDHRAKAVLFPGTEYRQALDDISRIAGSMERSSEFANTSKTALAGNGIGLVTMALAGSPFSAGGIAGSQFAFGKMLASPRFARWLASAPNKPTGPATLAHINRLTAIAASEPTIGNEVLHLQERLASAFTTQPMAAAASPDSEDRR